MYKKHIVLTILIVISFSAAVCAEEYVYKYQGKRDPFMALITPAGYLLNLEPTDEKKLNLEGIMYDPKGDSMAIVNGELIRVGDNVGTAIVTDIKPNKLIVLQDNEKIEVELRREE
ncbi:MAG TPA: hypothetical protein PLU24_03845 [Candidatus Omnitrophota bacterium]|nr:hypothetical protein [Candidatus Omnitrophota bacterium]